MPSSFSSIVMRHACEEGAEPLLALAALALIDVVDNVVGETGEHAVVIAAVEGLVVAANERLGIFPGVSASASALCIGLTTC